MLLPVFFRAAKYVFKRGLQLRSVVVVVLVIYFGSLIMVLPNSYYSEVYEGECWPLWPDANSIFLFYVLLVTLTFLVPWLISAFTYSYIGCHVHLTTKRCSKGLCKQRVKENKLLFKTMLCTSSAFFLFTAPYAIFIIIYMKLATYDMNYFNNHSHYLKPLNYVIFAMSGINCCVNPFIYSRQSTRTFGTKLLWSCVMRRSLKKEVSYSTRLSPGGTIPLNSLNAV